MTWQDALPPILLLPRAQQPGALRHALETAEARQAEAWNTAFAPDSLYDAWTRLPLMRGLYDANRRVLRPLLAARSDWHVVEIGGGNGALWHGFFPTDVRGTLTLIDPAPDAHEAVAAVLPAGVRLHSLVMPVQEAALPEADALVCSLTLHHVAGLDAAERAQFGLTGPGKRELLHAFLEATRARDGICLLNEADVYNEIDLAPGDPVLIDHFVDVYVRRCAMAVRAALDSDDIDISLKMRWEAIIQHWCVAQVENARVPRADRDVYELDVMHWLALLAQAGAIVQQHRFTDEWFLFHQYVFGS